MTFYQIKASEREKNSNCNIPLEKLKTFLEEEKQLSHDNTQQ